MTRPASAACCLKSRRNRPRQVRQDRMLQTPPKASLWGVVQWQHSGLWIRISRFESWRPSLPSKLNPVSDEEPPGNPPEPTPHLSWSTRQFLDRENAWEERPGHNEGGEISFT